MAKAVPKEPKTIEATLSSALEEAQNAISEQHEVKSESFIKMNPFAKAGELGVGRGPSSSDNIELEIELREMSPLVAEEAASQSSLILGPVRASNSFNSHRAFQVDPSLNHAGSGIVQGVQGPRLNQIKPKLAHNEPKSVSEKRAGASASPSAAETAPQAVDSDCTRCRKGFKNPAVGKAFKLCPHCRELQKARSRRWQLKTKETPGACRRCGVAVPQDECHFVLCPACRLSLRIKKSQRFEAGKCVHCSRDNDSTEFKVCLRCRSLDKDRRQDLEQHGRCNRCADALSGDDLNHKICITCRIRKRQFNKEQQQDEEVLYAEQQMHSNDDDDINDSNDGKQTIFVKTDE